MDVQFTDLPNALIACKVPEDLFNEGSLKVRRICRGSRPMYSINASILHSFVYFCVRDVRRIILYRSLKINSLRRVKYGAFVQRNPKSAEFETVFGSVLDNFCICCVM